ncbi:MAG: DedA family protein, partial [Deltaproteobacteria bacterium]|nr:DedA family protein [Deltaproteobacteria bacterium]
MDWYLLLIEKYGYLAILLGTLVEGEIFLALGGVFARQGLMNMWLVVAMAIAGSFLSHSIFYFLG